MFCVRAFEIVEVSWGDGLVGKVHIVEPFRSKSSFWWVGVVCYLLVNLIYTLGFVTLKKGFSYHRAGMENFGNFPKGLDDDDDDVLGF